MGCFSGCLMSSASIQKLFCGINSAFKWSFDESVGEKVVSPSYSSTILTHQCTWILKVNCRKTIQRQFLIKWPPASKQPWYYLLSSSRLVELLEEILSLFHSTLSLFLCIVHLRRPSYLSLLFSRTMHSVEYIFPFISCCLLIFFSELFVRAPQTITLPSCISFSLAWFWSLSPVQCYEPPSIVTQALCLSDLIPLIYLSLPLYNLKGFDLGHIWMV